MLIAFCWRLCDSRPHSGSAIDHGLVCGTRLRRKQNLRHGSNWELCPKLRPCTSTSKPSRFLTSAGWSGQGFRQLSQQRWGPSHLPRTARYIWPMGEVGSSTLPPLWEGCARFAPASNGCLKPSSAYFETSVSRCHSRSPISAGCQQQGDAASQTCRSFLSNSTIRTACPPPRRAAAPHCARRFGIVALDFQCGLACVAPA
mmetsp:Transcript_30056/g.77873  ORF Transcript_30056/g.77873 Transcript_30056/m.77873 type:complete len:201 (-) Transcript_30056:407-1009(-)